MTRRLKRCRQKQNYPVLIGTSGQGMLEWKKRGRHGRMNVQIGESLMSHFLCQMFLLSFFGICPSVSPHLSTLQQMCPFLLSFSLYNSHVMSCSVRQIMFSLIDHLWWWQRYQRNGILISRSVFLSFQRIFCLFLSVISSYSPGHLVQISMSVVTTQRLEIMIVGCPVLILRLGKTWV